MEDQDWIYIKDENPPKGAIVRVRGWHEITARYTPDNTACPWEQDEDAPQAGNAVQWRFATQNEISSNKSVCDDE